MRPRPLLSPLKLTCLLGLLSAAVLPAAEPTPPAHQHANPDGAATPGLKQELIAGLTEKDFLKLGDKPKTVKVLIVATWSDDNYGMNFNGYSKGGAVYTIPTGWTVEVTFINPGPVPHSLIVIEKSATKRIQMADPYFKGAAVPKHLQGMSYDQATFTFTADEPGDFAFACGFPTHAMNGHWIALDISPDAKEPTLKLGDKPEQKPTK
jgi:phenylpyruvate tautomerase PptA (4-oxalocrotonate tautomerase family)